MSTLSTPSALLSKLVADPGFVVENAVIGRDAPRLLVFCALSAAAVGAAAGSQHEGLQWLSAAVKMPLVFLAPPLFIVPALRAAASALEIPLDPQKTVIAALAAAARAAVFGAALSPPLWLLASWDGRYRVGVFLLLAVLGIAGLTGLSALRILVGEAPVGRRHLWTAFSGGLFALVAGQTGWHLSPFVLRPNLPVVFLDRANGDVLSTLEMRLEGPPAMVRHARSHPETEMSPRQIEELRELGYVDNTVVVE